jgi:hypothetical protein
MIMTQDDAWDLEEWFWLDGLSFYESHPDPECLMASPGMGVTRVGDILKSLRDARAGQPLIWPTEPSSPSDTLLALDCRAMGYREGPGPYRAFSSSTHRPDCADRKLVPHQQPPAGWQTTADLRKAA